MGSSSNQNYCAFTKAVEHLGDRWNLLIVRELFMFGPQGFTQLAAGLPGTISRSVLAGRLRRLEELGLVAHDPTAAGRQAPYQLAPAGQQLVPTLKSLWQWAEKWVPEDRAAAERDPTVIMWWLTQRVLRSGLPTAQTVLDLTMTGPGSSRLWLLLARDTEPTLCIEDPLLDQDRYVFVEATAEALLPVARGQRDWQDAIADGTVQLFGEPDLVRAFPGWFMPVLAAVA
jgi:DNA-binding HxlR family transcriptional regulator